MKKLIIGFLTVISFSAMANPCELEVMENVLDGKVGEKYRVILNKAEAYQAAGDQALSRKYAEQAYKVLNQVVELSTTACE